MIGIREVDVDHFHFMHAILIWHTIQLNAFSMNRLSIIYIVYTGQNSFRVGYIFGLLKSLSTFCPNV